MTWVMVIALIAAAFLIAAVALKAPRKGWEAIGAALMLGAVGFALQARPNQPGAPKQAEASAQVSGASLVEARKQLDARGGQPASSWTVIADGLARNGRFGDAAGVMLGAVEKDPKNADAWLALANDLVAHADGTLTPAAQYAYARAAQADPLHPGPDFFLGLALATNGKLAEGRAKWADLLARSPKDAAWRADLELRLNRLDAFIASQQAQAQGR
ncbi:MAG: cytochrome C biosynthesis protein [Sphingomonadales bacterium]|nr:cytochrome C biosynthesis protein [Sphingomonadales bacterium]